jgi:alkylation response protein AidB-like acyl-CoA dehydrogenase
MQGELFPEYADFRAEVRAFIAQNYPDVLRGEHPEAELSKAQRLSWHQILGAKGWLAHSWPVEYGGADWNAAQTYIFDQELARAETLPLLPFGLKMVAPVIYTFGSEDQKARFLPGIRSGQVWWCQGYSEPDAGSDLANVRTRAVRDGDHYIIDGHKTWTTLAQFADWIFVLARTDPDARAQEGISFFLVDMTTPGISVSPIITIDKTHEVNDVFFDQVAVPVENRIGEENRGWTYAKFLLGNERTSMAQTASSRVALGRLKERVASGPQSSDLRREVARLDVDLTALEALELEVLAAASAGKEPGPAASLFKIKGTEIIQRLTELEVRAGGRDSLRLARPDARNPEPALATRRYLNHRKSSIYGGSNEIQRNIIAKAVLGL